MPFRSEKQRRFMFANHPEIAHRWAHEYGSKPVPSMAMGQKRIAAIQAMRMKRAKKRGKPPAKLGAHPGFQNLVQAGVPAGALANAARNASPAAKKANPNLKKVPPKKKARR
jgi:hypothetical protein